MYWKLSVIIAFIFFLYAPKADAALLSITGMEGGTTECDNLTGTAAATTTQFYTGARSFVSNPATTATGFCRMGAYAATGAADNYSSAQVYIHFRFRVGLLPGSNGDRLISARDTGTGIKARLFTNDAGDLSIKNTSGVQIGATSSAVFATNTWYNVCWAVANGAAAATEVFVDGVSKTSGTGNLGTTNNGYTYFGKDGNTGGNTVEFFYDDMWVDDTACLGETAVVGTLRPTANGTIQNWTGGTNASDFNEIDETTPSGVDYVATTGAGTFLGQFNLTNSAVSGTIAGGMFMIRAREATSGTTNTTYAFWSGSSVASTTGINLTTTAATVGKYQNTDPATAAAWTTSAVDALQAGCASDAVDDVASRCEFMMLNFVYTPAAAAAAVGDPLIYISPSGRVIISPNGRVLIAPR